ncbi:MAG: [FeFe] hydrogenase H-cluster maturation GTPase HydF [Treponema sp.]|nr:[FeFe] hydrogenase H-cluster maturation GTPase HydF [Treponema sp.]MCL2252024.1 [FeFe] hydrogenase H-cluster maturation GTPase HydF [Treponema sp.]
MNETPRANRIHIAFFGRRNAGKSSLVNAVTGQNLAIVSDLKGTTTDPVYKSMELLPLGPVVIIDTPGFDDEGELGEMRVNKAKQVLNKTDIAVLVTEQLTQNNEHNIDEELSALFKARNIPFITVINKCDNLNDPLPAARSDEILLVSAKTNFNINLLKEKIAFLAEELESNKKLVADLIKPLDLIVLVIPIDKAAPKGRLILPQQQMIRDILEAGAVAISVKEDGLCDLLEKQKIKPALVITDSQVFAQVAQIVPKEIPLTSFSILFARYKGFLDTAVAGALSLNSLKNGDKILICEGCTHHRQCDDIGTVKIPRLIKNFNKTEPEFTFCSGGDFPSDLSSYKLIIHCGACMLNEREMYYRRNLAQEQKIPFTNYGTAIAHINGILSRSIEFVIRNKNE